MTACQTKNSVSHSDTIKHQNNTVEVAKAEWCRGQTPPKVGVSPEEFNAAPEWAKAYVRANNAQFIEACKDGPIDLLARVG